MDPAVAISREIDSLQPIPLVAPTSTVYMRRSVGPDGEQLVVGNTVAHKKVAILLPALNEEAGIGTTIDSIPIKSIRAMGYDASIIVVDGNSKDRTVEIALSKGAGFILQKGRGKGRGVRQALRELDADYVIMLDSDGTYPAESIPEFLEALEAGADVVIGSRTKGRIEPGAMSRTNLIGNHALSWLATFLYGRRCTDVCTGMWGFDKKAVDSLKLNSNFFEIEAEFFAQAVKAKLETCEVPIVYRARHGESKLGGVKTGLKIGAKLVRKRVVA